MIQRRRTPWRNHTGNQACEPLRLFRPETVADVRGLVAEAQRLGCAVRAVGSGHSWSDAALTGGFLVETHGLNRFVGVERDADGSPLARVEGGMRVRELNDHLARRGLALPNMGGYDGQTVAGVVSTSTHGSGIRYGPLSDLVRSLDLVVAGGELRRIEPSDGPTDPASHDGRLDRDDRLFRAAVVSLGSMGVIASLALRVTDAHWLHERRRLSTWPEVARTLASPWRVLHEHDHLEVYLSPYPRRGGPRCLVTTRDPVPEPPPGTSPGRRSRNLLVELASSLPVTPKLLNLACDLWPRITPRLLNMSLKALEDPDGYTDVSYRVLNIGTANYLPAYSSEIAVPVDEAGTHLEAVERIAAIARRHREVGDVFHTSPIALRFVGGSEAYLSMMHGRPITMMIELIQMTRTEGGFELLAAYEDALYELGGRPHWGQVNTLTPAAVEALYPRLEDWRAVRQELDPDGVFTGPLTKRVGLSAPAGVR